MPDIHPSAVVEAGAQLAEDVHVGPFCYVQSGAVIGAGTRLESHVTVYSGTTLGERNYMAQGAIVGGDPQDRKWKGEDTRLEIGDDNVFREYVTIHRSNTVDEATEIGNSCYLMAFVHVGHNACLHNEITIANGVGVSGHVTIEDGVNIGGMTGIHQFVRIGRYSMVGGMSRIVRDVPPFMLVEGMEQKVYDINAVGLRRNGITQQARLALHKACKLLFKSQINLATAIEIVKREVPQTPEVEEVIAFVERSRAGKNGRGDQR